MDGDSAILLRTGDPIRARMIAERLRSEGIEVATPGLEHRSMLGFLGSYVEIVVRVPRAEIERARQLVVELESAEPEAPRRGEPPVPLKRTAAFAALVFALLGGAHLYVRRWVGAGLVAAAYWAALAAAAYGVPGALLVLPLVFAGDLAAASWHCDRAQRGADPPGILRRFGLELAVVAGVVWVLWADGPGVSVLAGAQGRAVCAWHARCRDQDEEACQRDQAARRLAGQRVDRGCLECLGAGGACYELERCGCP